MFRLTVLLKLSYLAPMSVSPILDSRARLFGLAQDCRCWSYGSGHWLSPKFIKKSHSPRYDVKFFNTTKRLTINGRTWLKFTDGQFGSSDELVIHRVHLSVNSPVGVIQFTHVDWQWYGYTLEGRIWSFRHGRFLEGCKKKKRPHSLGYHRVQFWGKNSGKAHSVHRLLAHELFGPCPPGYEVHHKNHNSLDNRACNLEYVTPCENKAAAHRFYSSVFDF